MAPSVKIRPTVTFDTLGQDYVTETMHRGNTTIKRHYPVYRG